MWQPAIDQLYNGDIDVEQTLKMLQRGLEEKLEEGDEIMSKAAEAMDTFYQNPEERERYMIAFKNESDRNTLINEAIRKGISQGISQGKIEGMSIAVKRMLKNGISREDIKSILEISDEEFEKFQE